MSKKTETAGQVVSQNQALIRLYQCLNGPAKAGPKWVTYSRPQAEGMLYVLKQILTERGCVKGDAA